MKTISYRGWTLTENTKTQLWQASKGGALLVASTTAKLRGWIDAAEDQAAALAVPLLLLGGAKA